MGVQGPSKSVRVQGARRGEWFSPFVVWKLNRFMREIPKYRNTSWLLGISALGLCFFWPRRLLQRHRAFPNPNLTLSPPEPKPSPTPSPGNLVGGLDSWFGVFGHPWFSYGLTHSKPLNHTSGKLTFQPTRSQSERRIPSQGGLLATCCGTMIELLVVKDSFLGSPISSRKAAKRHPGFFSPPSMESLLKNGWR